MRRVDRDYHHLGFPRADYHGKLEKTYRTMANMIIEVPIENHRLLHRTIHEAPPKPTHDTMRHAIRKLGDTSYTGIGQIDAVVETLSAIGTPDALAAATHYAVQKQVLVMPIDQVHEQWQILNTQRAKRDELRRTRGTHSLPGFAA